MTHLSLAPESGQITPIAFVGRGDGRYFLHPRYDRALGLLTLRAWPTVVRVGSDHRIEWDNRYSGVLGLGKLYQWLPDLHYFRSLAPDLSPLFSLGLVTRRSWYLKALARKLALADGGQLPDDEAEAIRYEWHAFREYDLQQFQTRLASKLLGWPDPRAHWLWQGRMKFNRPCADWEGTEDVSLYRLLWTHYRYTLLLTEADRPRKSPAECSDEGVLRTCVNPHHFERALATKLGPSPRLRPGVRDDLIPTYKPIWHRYQARQRANGYWYIPCPNDPDDHPPLGGGAQEAFHTEDPQTNLKGRGYCSKCYERWKAHHPRVLDGRRYARRIEQISSIVQLTDERDQELATKAFMNEDAQRALAGLEVLKNLPQADPVDPMHPADGI